MDVGLGPRARQDNVQSIRRLNPCFSGCWSRTFLMSWTPPAQQVLILVLVDVGLGPYGGTPACRRLVVLILVLVDVGLGRLLGHAPH